MKANPLACGFLLLVAIAGQLPAQQPATPIGTNAAAMNKTRLLTDAEVGIVPPEATNKTAPKLPTFDANQPYVEEPQHKGYDVFDVAEAQIRYEENARTNRIKLNAPLYTNAPWSEIRLRAAVLAGDGLAASLCSDSNALHQLFWLSLAATNGWIPSQVQLARDFEYERPKVPKTFIPDNDAVFFNPELEEIRKQPRAVRQAAAQFWRSKAKAGLPKLKDDATRNDARAIYALGLLHKSGDMVESNTVIAAEMFHKAAESGLPPAQASWGSHCEWHLTNHVEAAKWFYQAATQGLVAAQSSLSSLHGEPSTWRFDPRFQPKASERARWTFELAAQPVASFNTYFACNELGELYLKGLGLESNAVEAVKWYRRAIDLGVVSNGGWVEYALALCYFGGDGVPQDDAAGLKWIQKALNNGYREDPFIEEQLASSAVLNPYPIKFWRKKAAQGGAWAQFNLGVAFRDGNGVARDVVTAAHWFQKSAEQGNPNASFSLGLMYAEGKGVPKDYSEALKWYRKAANQGDVGSQNNLGVMYRNGQGVPQDYVEAYKWYNLAAAQGESTAVENRDGIVGFMTPLQIAEGQRLAREFKPRTKSGSDNSASPDNPTATGTGFFITDDGYLITNNHVVKDAAQVRLLTRAGTISAKVVTLDAANDLALLKAEGKFSSLPIASSRTVRSGNTVATVGFPDIGLQGFAPKLAKGEIAALSGIQDDPRYFQISVPVQPGNSGGALVNERGNVVGVVSAKLSARAALAATGALPENVNYAIKSSLLLSFLESVPEVSARLKEPNTQDKKFEDVVTSAQQAAVLVLVY